MSLQNIYHYEQVTPAIASSGQPKADEFEWIKQAGYQTVINLAMADSDNAIPNEGSIVAGLGMTYIHLPVDFANPTQLDLIRFCRLTDASLTGSASASVWVHCVVNARVSAFLYLYLRYHQNLDEASCRTQLLDRWEPQMDAVWQTFLTDGAQWLRSGRV